MTYPTAYPARSTGRSNAGRSNVRRRVRRRVIIDKVLGLMLLGSAVAGMAGLVLYANERDARYFRQDHASFPSRPEECNGDCPPMDDYLPVTYGM